MEHLKVVLRGLSHGDDEFDLEDLQNGCANSLARAEKLNMCLLKGYDVPQEIIKMEASKHLLGGVNPRHMEEILDRLKLNKDSEDGYFKAYTKMIHFEEAAQSQFLMQFNTKHIQINLSEDEKEFRIKIEPKIADLVEAVEESLVDHFILKPVHASHMSIEGQIKSCNKDYIFMSIKEKDQFNYLKGNAERLYDISFHVNRMPYQLQHFALEWIGDHAIHNVLVNNPQYDIKVRDVDSDELFSVFRQNYIFSGVLASKLNEEQQLAVINIVQRKNMPMPYLLFGPAGTGKTRTLVAAIEEIVRSTNNSVLVCANSNAACDEMAERLIEVLHPEEMFRMYAKSFDSRKISDRIKPVCNWLKGEFGFPSLTYLYQFRVLICTLVTAGCLTRATNNAPFSPSHFSHVIIDESASTHETMTLIPIAGLCTTFGEIKSSIVLAGDPKQLDAMTKSEYAVKLGYKKSFMERLYEKQLYQMDPITGEYNKKFITQLVKNYRSHKDILYIPNKLFYDSTLQVEATNDITNWFIGSHFLPSLNFPIIFKTVQGQCIKSEKDFSLRNMKEIDAVMEYIGALMKNDGSIRRRIVQSDIGVVTPYKLQCKIIGRMCRKIGLKDITIGTTEVFQGQEKPIMIVSTVRTGDTLGFVKDPRRMNVILTRAKCLLIVIGDHNTLIKDPNWQELVYYCSEKRAIVR